jgi:hypothetical protein
MRELEKALGRDSGALREAPAVDLEGRFVDQLVGVVDPDRPQPPDIRLGHASQVLEGPIHD